MFVIHPSHFLPPRGNRARKLALFFLILAPIAVGFLALALGQDANWDLRNYHYYNAYAFINNRYTQDLLPSQTPYFYNPLLDVPFFELATHASARMTGFILGVVQGLNLVLLFFIAHAALIVPNARHKTVICAALATLGLLGGIGISLIGTTFGDNLTSLGTLLSIALVVRHLERLSIDRYARALPLALLFGIPAGLAMGLKLPSVIYAIGLCGGLLFIGGSWRRNFALSFAFGVGVLIGLALTFGPWAYYLEINYGNPIFPYFNQYFHSPYTPASNMRDVEYIPHSLHDILLMPFIFAKSAYRVGEIDWRDWRIPILYALLPIAIILRLFFGRNRQPVDMLAAPNATRYLLASFSVSYVVWLFLFNIYRYAISLEMVAPLLIVLAIGMLPLKISTRGLVAAFILAVISASIVPGNWHRRSEWLDHFVEAKIPDLGDSSHLMILMAGIEPYSHLIPEFPKTVSFVRIQSNFSSPEEGKGINEILQQRISKHIAEGGRFMVLIPNWQLQVASKAMSYFHLKMAPGPCLSVTDRLFDDKDMSLCPVIPMNE